MEDDRGFILKGETVFLARQRVKTICAVLLIVAAASSHAEEAGKRLLDRAKQDITGRNLPAAERKLRQALTIWDSMEPKPPDYLEGVGLLGVVVEGRLVATPQALRTQLEPILEDLVHQIMAPGFPGSGLMAARVLDVYGLLLQRTGREPEAAPFFERARALRFPDNGTAPGLAALKIGGSVSAPTLIHKTEPEYSEDARLAKHQGTGMLSVVVDENGLARDIRIRRSLGLGLDEKAVEAIAKWTFRPGQKEGVAVAVQCMVEVNFRLL